MPEKLWVCDDEASTRFPVYTRGNVGEVFVEVVSPLTWSAYGPHAWDAGWRDAFIDIGLFTADEFRPEGECEITGCFGGYVYINMSVTRVLAVRVPGMTVEAIDRSLFGDDPDVPPYRPDPRDENPERTAEVGRWLQSLFTVDPMPVTDQDRVRVDAIVAARPDLPSLTDAALLDRFRSLRHDARHMFRQHVLNTYGGNVLASVIVQVAQAVGAAGQASAVSAAVGDVDSAAQSFDLWDLSRGIRRSRTLSGAFDAGVPGLLDRLHASDDPDARSFLTDWDRFIARWGFFGPSVWEFRSRPFRDDPELVLRMLDRSRHTPDDASPAVRAAQRAREREAAVADIAAKLAGNDEARGQFLGAAQFVGKYLAGRERTKMHCAMVIDEARRAVQELGARLVARGHLRRWEDALMVTDAEADDFLASPARFAEVIAARAARLEMLRAKEPPFVFEGTPPPIEAFRDRATLADALAAPGTTLEGIGVSPGVHEGRARIIASLDVDSDLDPGDIIVATFTDASWGPLFLAAGGVVVELGAAVSHASIVSRELGIPAVGSVTGATRRIRDGARIRVDGNAGTVTVLD